MTEIPKYKITIGFRAIGATPNNSVVHDLVEYLGLSGASIDLTENEDTRSWIGYASLDVLVAPPELYTKYFPVGGVFKIYDPRKPLFWNSKNGNTEPVDSIMRRLIIDRDTPFVPHEIWVGDNPTPFTGNYRYRPDMQTKNWHYYEREDGKMLHIPKSCIGPVLGDTAENILKNRRSIPEGV